VNGFLGGKSALVTGAGGHIGSHLVRALVNQGAHVIAAVRAGSDLSRIADVVERVNVIRFDLMTDDAAALIERVGHNAPALVFHLGAAGVNPAKGGAAEIMQTNVMGTFQVLEAAKTWKPERFIFTGSCFEYGEGANLHEDDLPMPTAEYGASKVAGTTLALTYHQRYGLPVTVLRPFTAYGADEAPHRLIANAIYHCLRGTRFELTGGEQTRDFIHVDDVVRAYLLAAEHRAAVGEIFNVCTGVETSIRAAVELVMDVTGAKIDAAFGALPYRNPELWILSGDPVKAREKIGFAAQIGLREGIARTVEWFRQDRR